ncbi:Fucose permease [Clostridium cavendishii DSM 21758]|uniref:Fucose permease n=1 Tax=Clostridium cavendishii DSM 21758 TaxID=1121302 RepID=A0A1M6SZP8_9CLOT|nr:MFS transporter [Clostridium cavendishii]SHK50157.1 Fucose permease [Clostridium cavendishii DSM 21758]
MGKQQKTNWVTLTFIFVSMILAAITENTKGVFIPSFKECFHVGDTAIGSMLIITSGTYMILTFFGGILCEKIGQKRVFTLGIITIITSLIILSKANSFTMLLIGFGMSSSGLALSAIASNTIIPVIVFSAQTVIMNLLHFFYGFGSFVGQGIFGRIIDMGIDWRNVYFVVAIIYVVFLALFLFVKVPHPQKAKESNEKEVHEKVSKKILIAYMLGLGFYVFAEQGTGNWFMNFMKSTYSFGDKQSSTYLSLFFAIFTIGRLLGGFVVSRKGYFNVLATSMFLGTILYFIGLFMGANGVVVISMAGLFFSITFPTVVLTVSKVFTKRSAYITGTIVTAASFVGMILNWTMGFLNDKIGAKTAFLLVPTSSLICCIFMIYLYFQTKDKLVSK